MTFADVGLFVAVLLFLVVLFRVVWEWHDSACWEARNEGYKQGQRDEADQWKNHLVYMGHAADSDLGQGWTLKSTERIAREFLSDFVSRLNEAQQCEDE